MTTIEEIFNTIDDEKKRTRLHAMLDWISARFPDLDFKIAWNQPMFTHHGTYIIGFSVAKHHIAIAPETKSIQTFATQIKNAGYAYGSNLFKIKWTDSIDYDLLNDIIQYNIEDKQQCITFWRK